MMVRPMRLTTNEALTAFKLLDSRYKEAGYVSSGEGDIEEEARRFYSYYKGLREASASIVVMDEGDDEKMHGTISILMDQGHLPIDTLFQSDVARIRREGGKIAYVGKFATSREVSCTRVALRLMIEVKKICLDLGADICLCVIHPKHAKDYRRFGFKEITRAECMSGLKDAAAVLMQLRRDDVPHMRF